MGKDNTEDIDKKEKVKQAIIESLENGMWFKDACVLAGISEVTGHRLKALRGEELKKLEDLKEKKNLSDEEKKELKKLEEEKVLCESFESRVEAGILKYKQKMINLVNVGSIKDGRLALEVLRTRWPKEWPKRIELTGKDGDPIKLQMPGLIELLKNAKS